MRVLFSSVFSCQPHMDAGTPETTDLQTRQAFGLNNLSEASYRSLNTSERRYPLLHGPAGHFLDE